MRNVWVIVCVVCKVLTGAGLIRRTFKTKLIQVNSDTPYSPTVTCTTIPIFNSVFESFKIFTSSDMKQKGVPDFRPTISQGFFIITNLIDFGNTEI